jgi:chromosome segregation ATPase
VTASYTARAEHLADTEEHGDTLATIAGRCHATGLDPDVYRSAITATVILGKRPKRGPAWANDAKMVEAVEEITDEIRTRVQDIRKLAAEVQVALDQAEAELAAAKRALAGARNDNERAAARARMAKSAATITDCTTAIEILADADQKLTYVMSRLLAVPDELGDVYEAAYQTLGRGHRLPHDGRFLGATA